MGEEDRQRSAPFVGADWLKAVQQRRVEHHRCLALKQHLRELAAAGRIAPCRGPQPPRPNGRHSSPRRRIAFARSRRRVLPPDRGPWLRAWRARCRRQRFHGDHAQLARAGTHRRRAASRAAPGKLAAAGDDEDPPLASPCRRRRPAEAGIASAPTASAALPLHRVPVIMSGSAVCGAPSASSGAPWFQTSSLGTQSPPASGSKS